MHLPFLSADTIICRLCKKTAWIFEQSEAGYCSKRVDKRSKKGQIYRGWCKPIAPILLSFIMSLRKHFNELLILVSYGISICFHMTHEFQVINCTLETSEYSCH